MGYGRSYFVFDQFILGWYFHLPTAQDLWDCWADFSGLVQDHDGNTCGLQKCGIAGIAPWLTQQPPSFFFRVQPQVRRLYMNRVWDVEFARSDHGTTRRWLETSVPRIPKNVGSGLGSYPFQNSWVSNILRCTHVLSFILHGMIILLDSDVVQRG